MFKVFGYQDFVLLDIRVIVVGFYHVVGVVIYIFLDFGYHLLSH